MQFNQPIFLSNLEFELMGVEGVRSIGHVTIKSSLMLIRYWYWSSYILYPHFTSAIRWASYRKPWSCFLITVLRYGVWVIIDGLFLLTLIRVFDIILLIISTSAKKIWRRNRYATNKRSGARINQSFSNPLKPHSYLGRSISLPRLHLLVFRKPKKSLQGSPTTLWPTRCYWRS